MSNSRVLVTGGCGYIGSALVPQLLADSRVAEVVVFDSLASGSPANIAGSVDDQLTFRRGDVREYGDVRECRSRCRHGDPPRGDYRRVLHPRPQG